MVMERSIRKDENGIVLFVEVEQGDMGQGLIHITSTQMGIRLETKNLTMPYIHAARQVAMEMDDSGLDVDITKLAVNIGRILDVRIEVV